jgi:hypothetical protein
MQARKGRRGSILRPFAFEQSMRSTAAVVGRVAVDAERAVGMRRSADGGDRRDAEQRGDDEGLHGGLLKLRFRFRRCGLADEGQRFRALVMPNRTPLLKCRVPFESMP